VKEGSIMLPTLDEFLAKTGYPQNAYVRFPGMKSLYVRRGGYWVDTKVLDFTVQIASVEANKPRNGAFRHLIDHLKAQHPTLTIVVENVHSDLLAMILERWDFDRINLSTGRHFAWRSTLATSSCHMR